MNYTYLDKDLNVIRVDPMGTLTILYNKKEVDKMISPVKCCRCGKVFDLTTAKVVHRYTDCTQFITPCCKKQADDRAWKSIPDIESIRLIPDKNLTNTL